MVGDSDALHSTGLWEKKKMACRKKKEREKLVFIFRSELVWEADISISSCSDEIHGDYQILIQYGIILKDIWLYCSLQQPVLSSPCCWEEPGSSARQDNDESSPV